MGNQYSKPALNITQLLELMASKQIFINDPKQAAFQLQTVGYHRLSPYIECLHRNHNGQPLIFDKAFELYCFDRELRLFINDAIERIEIAFRACSKPFE